MESGGGEGTRGARRRRPLAWLIAGIAVLVVILVLVAGWAAKSLLDRVDPADLVVPPSERDSGSAGGSRWPTTPDESESESDAYKILICEFTGRALLDPGLEVDLLGGKSPQEMTLAPGSTFACKQPEGPTRGLVEMTARFGALGIWSGVGNGPGRITWDELPPEAARGYGNPPLASTTLSEVELLYPNIVVWVTITGGPYSGLKGKLVLTDWDLVKDDLRHIVEVVFRPTTVTFSPV